MTAASPAAARSADRDRVGFAAIDRRPVEPLEVRSLVQIPAAEPTSVLRHNDRPDVVTSTCGRRKALEHDRFGWWRAIREDPSSLLLDHRWMDVERAPLI
jgi:hypothetical protein